MNNSAWKDLIRPGILLLLIVVGCAVAARFLSGRETLADYARNNPELAYGLKDADCEENTRMEPDAPGTDVSPADAPQEAAENGAGSEELLVEEFLLEEDSADDAAPGGDIAPADTRDGDSSLVYSGQEEPPASPEEEPVTDTAESDALTDDSDVRDARITLRDGFFREPVPNTVRRRMIGVSYPEDCPLSLDELRYLNIRYVDFEDTDRSGELVCNAQIAGDLLEIFADLYDARYQLESVRLVDDFGGDDDASMLANNTSCFNYRTVAGSSSLSRHALGMAIDVNPFYNPWVNHGQVSPPEAAEYADRTRDFPHRIDERDYCYQCFINHGFFWGGAWNNPDYQHFQKN